MKPTLEFILVSLVVVSGLSLLAWLFERCFCKDRLRLSSSKYITTVANSAAIASILMLLEFPLLFLAPDFYKLDFSELPALISGFYLGPVAGVLTEFLKILIKLVFKPSSTALVGELANFSVGCALVLPASMIYHFRRTKVSAMCGLASGVLIMTVFGTLFNALYLLPAFASMYGTPLEAIIAMGTEVNGKISNVSSFVLLAVAPMNLLKSLSVSIMTLLLYKRIEPMMFKRS